MSSVVEVVVLVEGPTEQRFIKQLLAPYLAEGDVYLTPIVLSKPGEKGGDVKFARARNDIELHLKQRQDTWLTLMVDYYGIRADWPGYAASKRKTSHTDKAETMNRATAQTVRELFPKQRPDSRFIPYVSMHEFEALYFSDATRLADKIGVKKKEIDAILKACQEPENINDSSTTAPSKRLMKLSKGFKKTSTGISIAEDIGIDTMRNACPLFGGWLTRLESLLHF